MTLKKLFEKVEAYNEIAKMKLHTPEVTRAERRNDETKKKDRTL